jgi:hypothetical protein
MSKFRSLHRDGCSFIENTVVLTFVLRFAGVSEEGDILKQEYAAIF